MGLFDALIGKADEIAGKYGISPDQVQAIANTLQSHLAGGADHLAALKATAAAHGIPVDQIQGLLNHAGITPDTLSQFAANPGNLAGELGSFAAAFMKKG